MRACGKDRRIGECVAITSWQPSATQLVEAPQHRELALRRERRLGLVEQVEPVGAEALDEHGEERLAVRLLVQRAAAIARDDRRAERRLAVERLDLAGEVEEGLGAQEEVRPRLARAAHEAHDVAERRVGGARLEAEVAAAALRIEAAGDRDGLDQGRLAARVGAGQEGDVRIEVELGEARDRGNRERVGRRVGDWPRDRRSASG